MKTRWTEQEIQILKSNYTKMTRFNLQKLIPSRSLGAISAYAKKLNLVNYTNNRSWHSYINYNKSYFANINSLTCYWAGFIAADGYVDSINNKIRIKLAYKDLIQLQNFAAEIKFTGKIRTYTRNTNKGSNFKTCYLDLCGAKAMIKDLANNFNITNKKSATLIAPKITATLNKLAYFKGLIDGDGCIRKDGKTFELLCTENIANWVVSFCKDIDFNICVRQKKETAFLKVVYKTNLDLLYLIKNSTHFGLERKWSRLPYQVIDSKKSR